MDMNKRCSSHEMERGDLYASYSIKQVAKHPEEKTHKEKGE